MTASADASRSRPSSPQKQLDENTERPVREKLRDATIKEHKDDAHDDASEDRGRAAGTRGQSKYASAAGSGGAVQSGDASTNASEDGSQKRTPRTSPERKRNRDASDDGEADRKDSPKRKSSEESRDGHRLTSPQGKRGRTDQEDEGLADGPDVKRRPQDEDTTLPGGFSNASAISPFGAMLKSPSAAAAASDKQSSSSAFAASGFASFAKSPPPPSSAPGTKPSFTSLASSTASPFASASGTSVFGSATSSSVFGSKASSTTTSVTNPLSGFGKIGSGADASPFGATLPKSSAFGGPPPSKSFGSSSGPSKSLGAQSDEETNDSDEDGDGAAETDGNIVGISEDQKDERFFEQQVATGEEDEDTIASVLGKLFVLENKAWKERGVGVFKINRQRTADRKSRLIMRAKGSQKLILNNAIKSGIIDPKTPPTTTSLVFMAIDLLDGGHKPHVLKVKNAADTQELFDVVKTCLADSDLGEESQSA